MKLQVCSLIFVKLCSFFLLFSADGGLWLLDGSGYTLILEAHGGLVSQSSVILFVQDIDRYVFSSLFVVPPSILLALFCCGSGPMSWIFLHNRIICA